MKSNPRYFSFSGVKSWSIIHWNVAGELVRLKNMTFRMYSPKGILNAAFHQSSGHMQMLWYPHQMLRAVNKTFPLRFSKICSIWGLG